MDNIVLDKAESIIINLLNKIAEERSDICKDIFITGGWVRDKILGIPSKDMDICVNEEFVKPLIRRINTEYAVLKKKEDYDIVRCHIKQSFKIEQEPISGYEVHVLNLYDTNNDVLSVDIRKLRNDSVDADVYTRDFTVNSLYLSVKEMKIIDPRNVS